MIFTPKDRGSQKVSLVLLTIFTLFGIYFNKVTVFYMIYLFWCDEFIRSVFDKIAYHFKPEIIENKLAFKKQVSNRFFILFIYLVFILVIFGLIVDYENSDSIVKNFQVVFLKNLWFNITILNILGREIYEFLYLGKNQIHSHNQFSGGMIVLHISIIFGALLFFFLLPFISKFTTVNGNLGGLLAIIPFIILKFVFEWRMLRR